VNPSQIWTNERKQIARTEAQRWIGTPHRDRIAIVGVGIDCINFVYEVLIAAEILERRTIGGYNTRIGYLEKTEKLKRAFKHCAHVKELPPGDPQFGDIVIFSEGKFSAHSGIVIDGSIWHSLAQRTVTMSTFEEWQKHIDCLLRITEIGLKNEPMEGAKL
jgi:cell wall-associated NlpC family hydrolase